MLWLMRVHMFTVFQTVNGGAVRALGFPRAGHVQKHFGMRVPRAHMRQRAGAKHTAVAVQVGGFEFDRLGFGVHVIKRR